MDKIIIEDGIVTAISPEGKTTTVAVPQLISHLAPRRMDTLDVVLPDGVKLVFSAGPLVILVHQIPPRVHHVLWIASDSPSQFGPGTTYQPRCIALPYVVTFAVYSPVIGKRDELHLTGKNECFFRSDPIASADDKLCYPALLNCSRFEPPEGHPLSWICTEKLSRARLGSQPDNNRRIRAGLEALQHCLLETGFNYSSEYHEGSSWFTESKDADPRIATIEAWEAATKEDPLFVLDVPWLATKHTVRQVAERIFQNLNATQPPVACAGDLARFVFNQNGAGKTDAEAAMKSLPFELLQQLGL